MIRFSQLRWLPRCARGGMQVFRFTDSPTTVAFDWAYCVRAIGAATARHPAFPRHASVHVIPRIRAGYRADLRRDLVPRTAVHTRNLSVPGAVLSRVVFEPRADSTADRRPAGNFVGQQAPFVPPTLRT